ncbi:DUF2141 domain-containing protein [Spirosoma sp. BT702]|uniref:DUF2141 domain-containing protein n=1 Tax=Spirosoma profusum TaxID=2771354 RepID=A0A926XX99_9BACT|nr:DUF2141 domain-containing protein [Spirosoma profusum]MBD2702518.1 DUF2141 domain-containing protein [Spirosoma profusum]
MKTLIALGLLVFFSNLTIAQQTTPATSATATKAYSLTMVIHNVNNRTGKLYIGLAVDPASFRGESKQTKTVDVTPSGEISVVFEGLAPGRYAVRLYQDLNANNKLDFSGQIPAEPFGFSNITMLMGPPDFDQSSFELNENKSIRIGMLEM